MYRKNQEKVLLTGATGFVGGALLSHLPDAAVIGRSKPFGFKGSFWKRELSAESDYSDCFNGVGVVIHCAARVHVMDEKSDDPLDEFRQVNTYGTVNLAKQAAQNGVKRFIFVSSIKVNGEVTSEEESFRNTGERQPEDDYGVSKAEAEVLLEDLAGKKDMEVVIIRPPLVYGSGVQGNFASLLGLVNRGLPLPFGCVKDNQRSLVFVDNLVDLIMTCIDHPKAANQVFLVSDDNDVSTFQIVKYLGEALGESSRMIPVPQWCYRLAGILLGKKQVVRRLLGSLRVDIEHTKTTLGWTPPYSLEYGFHKSAQSFLRNSQSVILNDPNT